jgi:hypothetical protein
MTKRTVIFSVGLALVLAAGAFVQAQDHTYVGEAKCKMCHKTQHASWAETTHAKALDAAKASTDRTYGPDCLKCHATNASEELPGVQCEACHGPGSDYKKMSVMKNQEQAVANGLVIPSQETCDGCHVGDDHASSVVFKEQLKNKAAIHEFKNPPEGAE